MRDPDPATGNSRALTQQGAVFGTPEFMSPEQARGEVLDARSDIYSLCVILYEMITCKLPFKAKNPMDYISKHIKARPIPVHERVDGSALVQKHWLVMEKALRKERDDRYQSCYEFAEALKTWLDGAETVSSMPFVGGTGRPETPEPQAEPAQNPGSSGVHTSVKEDVLPSVPAKQGPPQKTSQGAGSVASGQSTGGLGTGTKVGIGAAILLLVAAIVAVVMMLT
jgi:serine/threonine-protein kinase